MLACVGSVLLVVCLALGVMFLYGWDSLEYQEMGLNYSFISETIETKPYSSGRYYLGLGNHFLKFPKMVMTVRFDDQDAPALQSRTRDGLNVRLEISFQYRLSMDKLYAMYTTLGASYEKTLVRIAIEQLTTAATMHNAHYFFTNRSVISTEMHQVLNEHFQKRAYSEVPFFQLLKVHLPEKFEEAIKATQVRQQDIQTARLQQKTQRVMYETQVLQAEQAVKVMMNEAEAEAASIKAANDAYCKQYEFTQDLQSQSLEKMMKSTGWTSEQLLEYLKIRAVRDHPSEKTTIRL